MEANKDLTLFTVIASSAVVLLLIAIASAIHHLHNFGFYFSPVVAKDLAANIRNHSKERIEISTCELEILEALFKLGSTREIADELCISTTR